MSQYIPRLSDLIPLLPGAGTGLFLLGITLNRHFSGEARQRA